MPFLCNFFAFFGFFLSFWFWATSGYTQGLLLTLCSNDFVLKFHFWLGLRDHMGCHILNSVNSMHGKCLIFCTISLAHPLSFFFLNESWLTLNPRTFLNLFVWFCHTWRYLGLAPGSALLDQSCTSGSVLVVFVHRLSAFKARTLLSVLSNPNRNIVLIFPIP